MIFFFFKKKERKEEEKRKKAKEKGKEEEEEEEKGEVKEGSRRGGGRRRKRRERGEMKKMRKKSGKKKVSGYYCLHWICLLGLQVVGPGLLGQCSRKSHMSRILSTVPYPSPFKGLLIKSLHLSGKGLKLYPEQKSPPGSPAARGQTAHTQTLSWVENTSYPSPSTAYTNRWNCLSCFGALPLLLLPQALSSRNVSPRSPGKHLFALRYSCLLQIVFVTEVT